MGQTRTVEGEDWAFGLLFGWRIRVEEKTDHGCPFSQDDMTYQEDEEEDLVTTISLRGWGREACNDSHNKIQ